MSESFASAPYSGMDSSSKHRFGPDGQNSRLQGPGISGMVDAYGNPIIIEEEQPKVRKRDSLLPHPPKQRPLPDLPDDKPMWNY